MSINACMDESALATARKKNDEEAKAGSSSVTSKKGGSSSVGSPTTRERQRQTARQLASGQTEEEEDAESAVRAKVVLDKSTQWEKIQYRELFNFFDVDKDRTWGTAEFSRRMTEIGCPVTADQAIELLTTAGVRDLDRITFDDFVQMMPKLKAFRLVLEKDALHLFQMKDHRGRGWITTDQMRDVLHMISGDENTLHQDVKKAGKEQIERMVQQADRERTGMVTYDFFIRALFGAPPVLNYRPAARTGGGASCFGLCGRSSAVDDDSDPEEDEFDWDAGQPAV